MLLSGLGFINIISPPAPLGCREPPKVALGLGETICSFVGPDITMQDPIRTTGHMLVEDWVNMGIMLMYGPIMHDIVLVWGYNA